MTTRRINASSNIDFTGSNYKIAKWSPAIARRDLSPLSLPFGDVVETMEVEVTGTDANDAYEKVTDLTRMLDEVTDFRRGDASAVTFDYEPPGASNGIQQALITRYLGVNYPTSDDVEVGANQGVIAPVTVQFERRGLWLEDTQQTSTQTTAADTDTVHTTSFSDSHNIRCPIDVVIEPFDANARYSGVRCWDGFLLLTSDSDGIVQLDQADFALGGATNWSKGASGSSRASSGSNVLKFSGSSAEETKDTTAGANFSTSPTRFVVFAAVKQTSGSDSFMLRCKASSNDEVEKQTGEWVQCSATDPTFYYMGEFNTPNGMEFFWFEGKPSGSGSVSAEIDRFVIMKVSDESYVVRTYDQTTDSLYNSDFSLEIEQRSLSALNPRFVFETNSKYELPHDGNLNIYMSGNSVSLYFAICGGEWQLGSGATVEQIQVTAKRRKARMVAT